MRETQGRRHADREGGGWTGWGRREIKVHMVRHTDTRTQSRGCPLPGTRSPAPGGRPEGSTMSHGGEKPPQVPSPPPARRPTPVSRRASSSQAGWWAAPNSCPLPSLWSSRGPGAWEGHPTLTALCWGRAGGRREPPLLCPAAEARDGPYSQRQKAFPEATPALLSRAEVTG